MNWVSLWFEAWTSPHKVYDHAKERARLRRAQELQDAAEQAAVEASTRPPVEEGPYFGVPPP